MAIQPLDLLPPVEVTFRDYALAVCRSQRLAEPLDPDGYHKLLIGSFREREILTEEDEQELNAPRHLIERFEFAVRHRIDVISQSRASAYCFLDDNREHLLIPASRDFFVTDLYDARKRDRQNLRLPRQIVLQYAWREEVLLEGARFGKFAGRTTVMLCGGTLVFNDEGTVLSWMMKPGSMPYGGKRCREGAVAERWARAVEEGTARRTAFLDHLAAQVATGRIGKVLGSAKGFMASHVPPMTSEEDESGLVRFKLSPHLHLSEDAQEEETDDAGERRWQMSY
jgi:hypothetical protein